MKELTTHINEALITKKNIKNIKKNDVFYFIPLMWPLKNAFSKMQEFSTIAELKEVIKDVCKTVPSGLRDLDAECIIDEVTFEPKSDFPMDVVPEEYKNQWQVVSRVMYRMHQPDSEFAKYRGQSISLYAGYANCGVDEVK